MTVEVSVIVPVYRQWHLVPDLLTALERQQNAPEFEVILADNDGACPPFLRKRARVVRQLRPGSYAARNAGAAQAVGRFLVFLDADCQSAFDWLGALARGATGGAFYSGAVHMTPPQTVGFWAAYDLIRGIPQARYAQQGFGATANLLVPRQVFDALGGFDERRFSGADRDFGLRASAAGFAICHRPDAVVIHPVRTSRHQVMTKARRIRGGQIVGEGWKGWCKGLIPPVRFWVRAASSPYPPKIRAMAIAASFFVWAVFLAETVRLMRPGAIPQRQ